MSGANHQIVDWTDEAIETLKMMLAAGATNSEIAAAIPGATRSAVAGKIMRLNRPRGQKGSAAQPKPQSLKPARIVAELRPTVQFRRDFSKKPEQPKVEAADLPPQEPGNGKGVKLFDLTVTTCRWPKGDPMEEGFLFCGEPTANLKEGRPYCPFHTLKSVDRTAIRSKRDFEKSALSAAR